MTGIWKYQYTKNITPLSEELLKAIYTRSQGILKLSLMVYIWTQELAISLGGDELLTPELVEIAFIDKGSSLQYLLDQLEGNSVHNWDNEDLGRRRSESKREKALRAQQAEGARAGKLERGAGRPVRGGGSRPA